jgi:hypothetical protein
MDAEPGHQKAGAFKIVASSVGVVAGICGMEHGFFEILQGNTIPESRVIEAIGLEHRFWLHGSEPAFTIIPNFLATGLMAMLVSLMVIIWSVKFINKRGGALVLLCLTVAMFLVGGGFAPPVCALLAVAAATGINRQFGWFRAHLPERLVDFLARLWKLVLIPFIVLASFAIIVAVFGYPLLWFFNPDSTLTILSALGNVTFFGLGPLVLLTSFAEEIQRKQQRPVR